MSKGKIAGIIVGVIALIAVGVGVGVYFTKDIDSKTTANTAQTGSTSDTANETKAPAPAKTPSPLPIEYTGSGDSESQVYHLTAGSYYFSYNVGIDPNSIQGSGGYGSISIELVNLNGESFTGVDEYTSGDGGTLSLGETVNKSDRQSKYSKTEKVTVTTGDYKITVKGGGVGPRVTDWVVRVYK